MQNNQNKFNPNDKRPVAPPKTIGGNQVPAPVATEKKTSSKPKKKRERKIVQPVFESRLGPDNETAHIPPLKDGDIRILHMGGVEEIGRNMSMVEYKDSIIIVDCGIQFSETDTPGIDFILPNTKYLEERKDKIKAMVITHGHLDHIGAIPYIMPRIGNPKIYARNFTQLMIRKRQEEFPYLPELKINIVETGQTIELGDLKVTFWGVSHAIPDAMGIIIETPHGDIVHTGDLRLDHNDGVPTENEVNNFSIFKNRKVLALMTDSTNCEQPGFSISDSVVYKNLESVIRDTPGRLIVSTFASQVERMLFMLRMCEKYGRKVVVEGRSMKTNIEVARLAEMLDIKPETLIPIESVPDYPPNRIVILATGAQGEEFAALGRIANKTHKYIKLNKFDTILMSSSIIPGNEQPVQKLKDNLSRQGAHLIHYKTSDVHSSGHANAGELSWIHSAINPKFFIPVHGYHYMLTVHRDIALSRQMPKENIVVPDNGLIIEIQNGGEKIVALPERVSNDIIVVDGTNVGKVQDMVLRDRDNLREEGIFIIIAIIDQKLHKLKKSPDIASRGFVYLKESQELLRESRTMVKNIIETHLAENREMQIDNLKKEILEKIGKVLYEKTSKDPVIVPVIITI